MPVPPFASGFFILLILRLNTSPEFAVLVRLNVTEKSLIEHFTEHVESNTKSIPKPDKY